MIYFQKLKKFGEEQEKEKIKFNKKIEEIQKGKDKVEKLNLNYIKIYKIKIKKWKKQMVIKQKLLEKNEKLSTKFIMVKKMKKKPKKIQK